MIQWVVEAGLFRNVNHAIWFCCTFAILITVIVQRLYPRVVWSVPLSGLIVHVSPMVNAVRVWVRGEESELYTRDCIIYNGFMVVIYLALYLWFLRRPDAGISRSLGHPGRSSGT